MIILYIVGGIAVLLLLVAAVMPKSYSISASTTIARPVHEVFDFVKQLKNQERYSVWVMADPQVKLTYTGVDGTVGFKSAWQSENKNVGVGEQEITKIIPGERYDVVLRFEKPFKATNEAYTTTVPVGANQTKVTTVFDATSPYPINIMAPMIRKMLLKDMTQNMCNLKGILENG